MKYYYSALNVLSCFYLFSWSETFMLAQLMYWDYFARKDD